MRRLVTQPARSQLCGGQLRCIPAGKRPQERRPISKASRRNLNSSSWLIRRAFQRLSPARQNVARAAGPVAQFVVSRERLRIPLTVRYHLLSFFPSRRTEVVRVNVLANVAALPGSGLLIESKVDASIDSSVIDVLGDLLEICVLKCDVWYGGI